MIRIDGSQFAFLLGNIYLAHAITPEGSAMIAALWMLTVLALFWGERK